MLMSKRYLVKVEEPAQTALAAFDPTLRAKFLRTMQILETDPFVSFTGGFDFVDSRAVITLRNAGYDIRRLKARAIGDWRIFYYVDKKKDTVLVWEIVKRDDDTYDITSPLAQRLKKRYRDYPQGR